MKISRSVWGTAAVVLGALALLSGAGGCGSSAELTLRQPFAPRGQQQLRLASDWGFTRVRGDLRACLLAFPLPGSQAGPRDFLVYVVLPDAPGRHIVRPFDPDAARGFLIQQVGALAGKTALSQGIIELRPHWLGDDYQLELDVLCEDETALRGRARLVVDPVEVGKFERQYAADIAALRMSDAPSDETRPRPRKTQP